MASKTKTAAKKGKAKGTTTVVEKLKADVEKSTAAYWAKEINEAWALAADSFLVVGEKLLEAKEALSKKYKYVNSSNEWRKLMDLVNFGERTAQYLMKIAGDKRIQHAAQEQRLPPSWGTLRLLTQLDDDSFSKALARGQIHPGMERAEAEALIEKSKPKEEEPEGAEDEPEGEETTDAEFEEVEEAEVEVEEEDDDDASPPAASLEPPKVKQPPIVEAVHNIRDCADDFLKAIERFEEEVEKPDGKAYLAELNRSKLLKDSMKADLRELESVLNQAHENVKRILKTYK